jgi:hypothetical protein
VAAPQLLLPLTLLFGCCCYPAAAVIAHLVEVLGLQVYKSSMTEVTGKGIRQLPLLQAWIGVLDCRCKLNTFVDRIRDITRLITDKL